MRMLLALALVAVVTGLAAAGEPAGPALPPAGAVTLPWEEFRELYRERVEREIMEKRGERERSLCTLEEAVYRLRVTGKAAAGSVLVSGRVLEGAPGLIPLLTNEVVVRRVESIKGGALVPTEGALAFLPEGKGEFQVALSVLVPVREDRTSQYVAFGVPPALRNRLTVELPARARLLSHPGLADGEGAFLFSAAERVELRFEMRAERTAAAAPELDALTLVRLEGRRLVLATCFAPARPHAGRLALRLPAGARFLEASPDASRVRRAGGGAGDGSVEIDLPAGSIDAFTVRCALEAPEGDGRVALRLPAVEGNTGRAGFLLVEEPDHAELSASGEGLAREVPASRLPPALRPLCPAGRPCLLLLAPGAELALAVRRFRTVETPEVVLDQVEFFTAFEETGGALSVLRMRLPARNPPRLRVARVPGAELWSLRVNGARREVYGLDEGSWIVPLARGAPSQVELAFLRRGGRLGLEGRLEAVLPATGLPARRLLFGVALPERVELLSLEAELSPARAAPTEAVPDSFVGRRHWFERAFHRGEGLKASLHYREPAEERAPGVRRD